MNRKSQSIEFENSEKKTVLNMKKLRWVYMKEAPCRMNWNCSTCTNYDECPDIQKALRNNKEVKL